MEDLLHFSDSEPEAEAPPPRSADHQRDCSTRRSSVDSSSCEVVAVFEKSANQHVNVRQQGQDNFDMATDATSSLSLLDCSDDNFMSAFSRLPPDGHEFPPNYLELDCPAPLVNTSDSSYPEPPMKAKSESAVNDLLHFGAQKHWQLEPPTGFEDPESCSPPPINLATIPKLDRSNTVSSSDDVSSKSGDTVIFGEMPPPSSSLEDLASEAEEDLLSEDEPGQPPAVKDLSPSYEANRKVFMTEPPEAPKRIPPIPPKRTLLPKTLIAERAVKVEDKTPAVKPEDKSLSVKDKIAMFSTVSKADVAPPALPATPKPRTLKPVAPKVVDVPKESTEDIVSAEVRVPITPEAVPVLQVENALVDEEPIAVDPRSQTELLTIGPYAPNGNDYYHDRSGSSLSMSSCFSKSSDDLLSQDMDSSDFDDHPHHVGVPADRKTMFQNKRPLPSGLRNGNGSNDNNNKNSKQYWSTSSTDSDAAAESQVRSSLRNKSMYALLESRKQNVSKLKGLVIPQVQETQKSATELPLIFSVDSVLLPKVELTKGGEALVVGSAGDNEPTFGRPLPKTPLLTKVSLDSQKYSPAFKRKPFTLTNAKTTDPEKDSVTSTGTAHLTKKTNSLSDRLSHLVPMAEDENDHLGQTEVPAPRETSDWFEVTPPPLPKTLPPNPALNSFSQEDLPVTADLDGSVDTEDQESGISSIESPNASIHNTPPGSPKEVHHSKQDIDEDQFQSRRKDSGPKSREWESNSTATDSDQSSTDPRILKANSVEAINRKNVLQSSRHSSGEFKDVIDGMDFTVPSLLESSSRKTSLSESSSRKTSVSECSSRKTSLSKRGSDELKEQHVSQTSRHNSGELRNAIDGMEFTALVPMDGRVRKTSLSKRNSAEFKEPNALLQSSRHRNSVNAVDISGPILTEVVGGSRKSSLSHVTSICPLEQKELNSHKRQVSVDEKVTAVTLVKMEATVSASSPTRCKGSVEAHRANDSMVADKAKTVSDERWLELERKYGPKTAENGNTLPYEKASPDSSPWEKVPEKFSSTRDITLANAVARRMSEGQDGRLVLSDRSAPKAGGKNFKALAESWEQRAVEPSVSPPSSLSNMKTSAMLSKSLTSIVQNGSSSSSAKPPTAKITDRCATLDRPPMKSPAEKAPLPTTGYITATNGVKMREKTNVPLSRPTSLIESDTKKSKLWEAAFENGSKLGPIERTRDATAYQMSKLQRPGNQVQDMVNGKNRRSTSFNDLRQIFENQEMSVPSRKSTNGGEYRLGPRDICNHIRMSSLDSTCTGSDSEEGISGHYGSATSLGSNPIDHYGSITSLASSTSLISPQELQQLIDEANQSLEESGTPSHEITVVVLQREIPGGSIGITLAGGADYDSKEITVNKVINGSLADRDGRIQKGDRVLSINGKNLKGVSHREALIILKAPRTDCVLVLSRGRSTSPHDGKENGSAHSRISNCNLRNRGIKQSAASAISSAPSVTSESPVPITNGSSSILTVQLVKDASGLGFSLDGGKDSPMGDRPLTIKKIFVGGAANKNGTLQVGDEILSFNGIDVTKMARIEAWSYMRKLPDGNVTVVVNQKN